MRAATSTRCCASPRSRAILADPPLLTDYAFRPLIATDLPMVERWLHTPAVAYWWPNPAAQYDGIVEDMAADTMTMLIVAHAGRDFAFSQHSNIHAWGVDFARGLPADCRAIDSFIGEPALLGRGHGPGFIRRLAQDLRRDCSMVTVDPHVENTIAIRAYEKAGFRGDRIVDTPDGPSRLMTFAG